MDSSTKYYYEYEYLQVISRVYLILMIILRIIVSRYRNWCACQNISTKLVKKFLKKFNSKTFYTITLNLGHQRDF